MGTGAVDSRKADDFILDTEWPCPKSE
jgi:hypothetical protein